MIGLSLSQSLLRPRQSGVGLDAVGAHGGPGWAHTHRVDSLQSHEPSNLLHTRGQPQQPQRMSMASMSQRASIRRTSFRRATECPFELLTLDARRLSALAAARRRSSSTRSGSMASNALAERCRGNTTVSAPEAQLQQQQSLLHQTRDVMYLQSIQIDEPPVATSVSGESIATVRRKELNPSGHHEQRRESTSELKRRMRALSKASSCGVILEEPGDTNSDTCTGRLSEESAADAAGAPGEAAVNASASELDRKLASQFDGGNTQSQLKLSSNIEAPQPQNRSRASSSFHEKALFSPLDSYATQVPLRTSLQAIDRQAFADVDEELLDEVEAQMVPMAAGDFTHARPGDEFRHALFWGVVVAVLLLVSGKLLQWVEGTQEASGVALIASAEKKLEHSLERSFEALLNTCSPNQITNNSEYSGNGSGNGNCRDAVALQNSVSQFVDELRAALEKQIEKKYAIDINQTKWTFANAAFVQWTAITTIGYGHIAPTSVLGRTLIVLTSIAGIPIFIHFVMHLTRLFLVLVEMMLAIVVYRCQQLFSIGRSRSCSSDPVSKGTSSPASSPSSPAPTASTAPPPILLVTPAPPDPSALANAGDRSSDREQCKNDDVLVVQRPVSNSKDPNANEVLVDAADESAPFDMNEEFTSAAQRMAQCARRHLWVVMLMVPPFSMLLALAVHLTEPDWHFLEALYYTFISLSTIGFGDLVPSSALVGALFALPTALGIGLYAVTFEAIQNSLEPLPERLELYFIAIACNFRRCFQRQHTSDAQQTRRLSVAPIVVDSSGL